MEKIKYTGTKENYEEIVGKVGKENVEQHFIKEIVDCNGEKMFFY